MRSMLVKPDEDYGSERAIRRHFEEDSNKGKIKMTAVQKKKSRSPALAALTDVCFHDKI